jgi:D-isomer specific 2-hydroxyacid dehydrogenase-like protein
MRHVEDVQRWTCGLAPGSGFVSWPSEGGTERLRRSHDGDRRQCQTGEADVLNVARGEIVDEEALLAALGAGKLRGVGLDVYDGEFEHAPTLAWQDERVLITPHISGGTEWRSIGESTCSRAICAQYLDGQPT